MVTFVNSRHQNGLAGKRSMSGGNTHYVHTETRKASTVMAMGGLQLVRIFLP